MATDGSANAGAGLNLVRRLTWPPDCTADVLVVADKHGGIGHMDEQHAKTTGEAARELLERTLPNRTRLLVRNGSAKDAIADVIAKDSPDLVVLGAHSRSNVVQQMILGNVAQHLVTTGGANFLIARSGAAETVSKIVVCFSSEQQAVSLTNAMQLVPWPATAEFVLLHVFAPLDTEYTPSPQRDSKLFREGQVVSKSAAEAFLAKCKERLQASGLRNNMTVRLSEDLFAPKSILEISAQLKADMLVLGRREHTSMDEFLLGSVSKTVVHESATNVLLALGR